MNNRKATYQILSKMSKGDRFKGWDLRKRVFSITGEMLYPATAIRYLRKYRIETGVNIACVNKRKSIYEVK